MDLKQLFEESNQFPVVIIELIKSYHGMVIGGVAFNQFKEINIENLFTAAKYEIITEVKRIVDKVYLAKDTLEYATRVSNSKIVEIFFNKGIQLGKSVEITIRKGKMETLKFFAKMKVVTEDDLTMCAECDRMDMFDFLVDKGLF